jgi:hypothetical protein
MKGELVESILQQSVSLRHSLESGLVILTVGHAIARRNRYSRRHCWPEEDHFPNSQSSGLLARSSI